MKVLLDTHAFLWAITDDERLSVRAREVLRTADLWLSVISLWEIITKVQMGKLTLPEPPSRYFPRHIASLRTELLVVKAAHVLRLELLPIYHRDPFDRLLLAQSLEEGLPLLTADGAFAPYGAAVLW